MVCLLKSTIYTVYYTYGIRCLMALEYVLSVIMMQYTVSYRAVYYLVNRLGIQFATLHIPNSWHLPNAPLNIYFSSISFLPLNLIEIQKNPLCVIQFLFVYVQLGNSECCVVLACALPFICSYNFKVVWQTVLQ